MRAAGRPRAGPRASEASNPEIRAAGRPRAGPRASEASNPELAPAEPALEVERPPVAVFLVAMWRLLRKAPRPPGPQASSSSTTLYLALAREPREARHARVRRDRGRRRQRRARRRGVGARAGGRPRGGPREGAAGAAGRQHALQRRSPALRLRALRGSRAARSRRRAPDPRLLRRRRALPARAVPARPHAGDRGPHGPRAGRDPHRSLLRHRVLDGEAGHLDGAGALAQRRPRRRQDQVVPRPSFAPATRVSGSRRLGSRSPGSGASRSATARAPCGSCRTAAAG